MAAKPPSDALVKFGEAVKAGAPLALDRAAAVLSAQIARELSQPGSGRFYARTTSKRDGKKARAAARILNNSAGKVELAGLGRILTKLHRASAPGEPPAPDTGNLKRSGFIEAISTTARRVGVAAVYGKWLEFGTPRIAPRPFMRPALAKAKQRMGDVFASVLTDPTKP